MEWKQLPDHARVWIYQANRLLTNDEVLQLKSEAEEFVRNWSSHGTPLRAAIEVFHNLFIVIFVDEAHAKATGCSIDKSMGFVQSVENKLNISFTDRMQIAYKEEEELKTSRLPEISELAKRGAITASTKFFDNLVSTKKNFEEKWLVNAGESWIERFL